MSNYTPLHKVATYSDIRISLDEITEENYISTSNLKADKKGVEIADNLPPNLKTVPAFNEKDILIANIRPYLKKIWFADKQGGCSSDVLCLQVNKEHHPEFIYYALFQDLFFKHIMLGAKGTRMPRGDRDQILNFPVLNIGLAEQKKIASILSTLDKKIEVNNQINAELEAMAKTLYDYWFLQFDFPDENGKPYRASGGEMVYSKELGREIPKGWKTTSLWDIADYYNGLAMQRYRPKKDEDFLPVIKIREMNEGISDTTEKASINIPSEAVINDGDILFSWSATLSVQIWVGGKGALNQHIFKVTSNKYPKSYYYFELINYLNHFKMMAEQRKTTMGHITQDHLKFAVIPSPPLELIDEIDNQISPILKKIVLFNREIHELEKLRDWLLPMLMNGQVTVMDEPL